MVLAHDGEWTDIIACLLYAFFSFFFFWLFMYFKNVFIWCFSKLHTGCVWRLKSHCSYSSRCLKWSTIQRRYKLNTESEDNYCCKQKYLTSTWPSLFIIISFGYHPGLWLYYKWHPVLRSFFLFLSNRQLQLESLHEQQQQCGHLKSILARCERSIYW